MKYSFVLPAYKATFLRESIDSILNQTYKDFELIIVNDASPEDLTTIVNSYCDVRIQYYINEKNIGGSDLVAQWNHCITYAQGDYLILASDDDVYHFDYLEKMDVLINRYPYVDVFRPRVRQMNANGSAIEETEILPEFLLYIDFLYFRYKAHVSSGIPFYIFKRDTLVDVGGFVNFPSAWISDDATVIRLARNGVVSHNEVLFSFRMSGLNISSRINNSKMLYDKLRAQECYFRWYEHELKSIPATQIEDKEKIALILTELTKSNKLDYMAALVKASDKRSILSCWLILRKIESLNIFDCIIICAKVYKRIAMNKFRNIFSR